MEGLVPMPAYAHDPAISIDIAFESSAVKQLNQYWKQLAGGGDLRV
jgi:hypothetical protein